jgi:hypothetical protein
VTELVASGPLRYLGGSIETFALPMGTFIVIAWVLFAIYRRPHGVPRLKYLRPAHQSALGTREPGIEGPVVYVAPATVESAAAAPRAEAPAEAETATAEPAGAESGAESPATAQASGAGQEESSGSGPDGTSAEGETF